MSKKKEHQPISFAEVDPVRNTMAWHMQTLIDLYKSLEPHHTKRGIIAGCDEEKENALILFKGNVCELFKVKEFIEGLNEQDK